MGGGIVLGLDAFPGRSICILEASVQDGAALRAAAALQTGLAIVDERLVIDAAQLVAAAAASLRAHRDSAMVTSHLHAELLYRMSPSTNIAESLRTIGVRSDTTAALLVSFDATPSEMASAIPAGVREAIVLRDARAPLGVFDEALLREAYALPPWLFSPASGIAEQPPHGATLLAHLALQHVVNQITIKNL